MTLLLLVSLLQIGVGKTSELGSIRLPGSLVELTLPPGFVRSPNVEGFENPVVPSSLYATELCIAFSVAPDKLPSDFSGVDEQDLISYSKVKVSGNPGLLMRIRDPRHGETTTKAMLLISVGESALSVVARYPARSDIWRSSSSKL